MNKEIVKKVFPKMVEDCQNGICPICKQKINPNEFRDELSAKEYNISGLCNKCQSKIFN